MQLIKIIKLKISSNKLQNISPGIPYRSSFSYALVTPVCGFHREQGKSVHGPVRYQEFSEVRRVVELGKDTKPNSHEFCVQIQCDSKT